MHRTRGNRSTAGVSLIEVMLVLIVIGVGAAMAVPRFGTASEQMSVDQAASALRTVWVAERLWWLERHEFCDSLDDLVALRLLDQPLVDQASPFELSLLAADESGFTARMARSGSDEWAGELLIDETGVVSGYSANGAGLHVLPQTP